MVRPPIAMDKTYNTTVQREGTIGRIGPKKIVPLPIERLHPNIRIAHRLEQAEGLDVPTRIIFDHLLVLVIEGSGSVCVGNKSLAFCPNHLFFIKPFVKHSFKSHPGQHAKHVAVHFDLAPDVPGYVERPARRRPYSVQLTHGLAVPTQTVLPAVHPNVRALIDVVSTLQNDAPTSRLKACLLVTTVLLDLLGRSNQGEQTSPVDQRNRIKLERVAQYVKSNLDQPMGVEELAEVADLSPSHLNRLMRSWIGKTPYEYISEARIDYARELLGNADLTIKEIAVQTGFRSSHHFSRIFRRIDGLAPTQYRETLLTSENLV